MRVVRGVSVAAVLALLALLVWDLAHGHGGGAASKVDKGQAVAAPKLELGRLNGEGKLSLASLRGKVVVVNFWQSTCIPCRQEARGLVAASKSWSARRSDVVFLGVDTQDFNGPARKYLRKYGITYPNVRDPVGNEWPRWGVTGVPETFFIDRRGRVVPPHIVGQATRAAIDAGVRRALSA
jgi:cytochrome c biogenesis protein CcmG, thiol:disulfide interchange protein DsbE